MGMIYCIMGKSASGKDSVYREVLKQCPQLRTYVMYTTRPRRSGETDGVTYHFVDGAYVDRAEADGRLIEKRVYDTVYGPWVYATIDDGSLDKHKHSYLMPATLESYAALKSYFGADSLVPIYIEVDDGERLKRAIKREQDEAEPKYAEVCRRFLADEKDFSDEKLDEAGITRRFYNRKLRECAAEIVGLINETAHNTGKLD